MNIPDRYLDFIPWAIATLIIAAIVHIVSVLLMPAVAPRDAYARLAAITKASQAKEGVVLLPAAAPGAAALPFEDPALAEGVCLYDLSKGLLHIAGPADGEDYLAVSFHAVGGRLYHAINDRSAIKGKIDIVVGDAAQIEALESTDDEDSTPQEVRITAPTRRGFVLIRALAKRESDAERARARVTSIKCERFAPPAE